MSGNPSAGAIIIGTLSFREPERLPAAIQSRLRELAAKLAMGVRLTVRARLFIARAAFIYLGYE